MKRFLIKISFFLSPFILLIAVTDCFYSISGGDLNRIGKISVAKDYRTMFSSEFNNDITYKNISELDLTQQHKFDVFNFGDSFSDQENYGYQNYLSNNYNLNVLNFNSTAYDFEDYNPLQYLFAGVNGDMFNNLKVNYVVLEVVTRDFIKYHQILKKDWSITLEQVSSKQDTIIKEYKVKSSLSSYLNNAKNFYFYNLGHFFNDRAFSSDVYRLRITKPLFSANNMTLLFYARDIQTLSRNTEETVASLNSDLNILAEKLLTKGIVLIVLPAPDKYDIYSDYIEENPYADNLFFNYLNEMPKSYMYINTKMLFRKQLEKGEKDIYFADDTHWSPKGSKIIATEINALIKYNRIN